MTKMSSLHKSEWAALVDLDRLDSQRVIQILRALVTQSFDHVYGKGPKPVIGAGDRAALRGLFAGTSFLRHGASRYLGFLHSLLYFTGRQTDFCDKDLVLAVGATTLKSSFLQRLMHRQKAKRCGLLGGEQLIATTLWVAFSDAGLQMHGAARVRENLRARVLFLPEAVDWPDRLSDDFMLAILCLALAAPTRQGNTVREWLSHWIGVWKGRRSRRFTGNFSRLLPDALAKVKSKVDVEHLILLDGFMRFEGKAKLEGFSALAQQSPFAQSYRLVAQGAMPDDQAIEHLALEEADDALGVLAQRLAWGLV